MKARKKTTEQSRVETQGEIVCGIDFSVQAQEAADVAGAIARRMGIPLRLLHVRDESSLWGSTDLQRNEFSAGARQGLEDEAMRLRRLGTIVEPEFLFGRPETELIRRASRPGVRMVVMASLGNYSIGRLLIGSVAERTAEAAPVPTLVVRESARFLEWVEGKRPLRVFVAGDLTTSSDSAILWVRELRRVGECCVVVGHAGRTLDMESRAGTEVTVTPRGKAATTEHPMEHELRARLHRLLGDTTARVRISSQWGTPVQNILEMAEEEGADIVVVGSHQRRGLDRWVHPSVSNSVLHNCVTNVACIPVSFVAGRAAETLPEIRRVLVTTDFSDCANSALPYAYATLAHGGCVRLVHVMPPHDAAAQLGLEYGTKVRTPEQHAQLSEKLAKRLRSLIPGEGARRGIRSDAVVLCGRDSVEAVREEAERFGADLICIGSHGRSGIVRAVMGSMAQKLLGVSRIPVLVVRMTPP